jgi:hypothetical protein
MLTLEPIQGFILLVWLPRLYAPENLPVLLVSVSIPFATMNGLAFFPLRSGPVAVIGYSLPQQSSVFDSHNGRSNSASRSVNFQRFFEPATVAAHPAIAYSI